jgi:hypothetical protein
MDMSVIMVVLKNMPKLDHTHTTEKMENGDRVDQIIFED